MNPITFTLIASALGAGLSKVGEMVGDKLVETAIEPSIELVKSRMLKGYESEQAVQELRQVVTSALDAMRTAGYRCVSMREQKIRANIAYIKAMRSNLRVWRNLKPTDKKTLLLAAEAFFVRDNTIVAGQPSKALLPYIGGVQDRPLLYQRPRRDSNPRSRP